jgi:hypothetical protein
MHAYMHVSVRCVGSCLGFTCFQEAPAAQAPAMVQEEEELLM